jgi:hypothetical protein
MLFRSTGAPGSEEEDGASTISGLMRHDPRLKSLAESGKLADYNGTPESIPGTEIRV